MNEYSTPTPEELELGRCSGSGAARALFALAHICFAAEGYNLFLYMQPPRAANSTMRSLRAIGA